MFQFGGAWNLFKGQSPPKLPRGDWTGSAYSIYEYSPMNWRLIANTSSGAARPGV